MRRFGPAGGRAGGDLGWLSLPRLGQVLHRQQDSKPPCLAARSCIFDRLYVLRNQIVHGGATWDGSVNRNQACDGAAILAFLMPLLVSIMMEHPDGDWGRPFYPVVEAE